VEGTPFGRYRLVELLGHGGMGEVWRAYDTATDRVVALKVLPANFVDDEVFQERFRREARAAAGLDEPHVVPIHDFGEIDGRLYVTMRLIKGRDLEDLLEDGPLPPERAVKIIEQISSALNAAHEVGLVHRDVKPSNILVTKDDFAYLIDFGIARAAEDTGLTGTGAPIGTWAYMAPERFRKGTADARADVYALTCVLYESLTRQRPFHGQTREEIVAAHLFLPPPKLPDLQSAVREQMDEVIATGLAKEPDRRYPTTKDLAKAARAALTTRAADVPGGLVPDELLERLLPAEVKPRVVPTPSLRRRLAGRRPDTDPIGDAPSFALVLRYAARADRGLVYANNEDCVYAGARLQAVADGMGNPTGGEVASRLVVAAVAHLDDEEPGGDMLTKLKRAVTQGNDAIAAQVQAEPALKGMGTTLTAIFFAGNRAALAHIGGSRAYLLRDGDLTQITQDEFLIGPGAPVRTRLMRRLTGDQVPITLKQLEVRAGDRYLLCTHGLTDPVNQDTILEALKIPDVAKSADRLVELALRGGGPDNVTLVVTDIVLYDMGHAKKSSTTESD
jgi:serine/threonine protein phosphatase PrpC/predicted Ser/Thr protein kinase